jgi:hypothetical protein
MAELSSAAPENPADRKRVADRLRSFVADHGGPGTAVIAYLGRPGARIVVVAADGRFADAVVPSTDEAVAACESAGIPVGSWDRELTSGITVTHHDRVRMAGTGR